MNSPVRYALLVTVEILLCFFVLCVFPFAWILKDGLGPNSVTSTGVSALYKAFGTFYVGPLILLLASFDILIRKTTPVEDPPAARSSMTVWVVTAVTLAVLSVAMIWIMTG